MILLVDTSSPIVHITINDSDRRYENHWEAGRELAKGLLGWLEQCMSEHDYEWRHIKGIGVYKGPGSFTGLRIGMSVLNTVADELKVPIVAESGGAWQTVAFERLTAGQTDGIALPVYDRAANITKPRK